MQLQPVNSSQINAIGYAPATKTLQIEFKGGSLYEYANVPPDLFEAFAKAPSIGSFFFKNIKNAPDKYPYVKLENNQAVDPVPVVEEKFVDKDRGNLDPPTAESNTAITPETGSDQPAETTEELVGDANGVTADVKEALDEAQSVEEHEQPGGGGL